MAEEINEKEAWSIWIPLGGFKRGMGLLAFIFLVVGTVLSLNMTGELQALLTTLMSVAIGGNVIEGRGKE